MTRRAMDLQELVAVALEEDGAHRDWTTLWTVEEQRIGVGEIVAKEEIVVCGMGPAELVFRALSRELEYRVLVPDGGVAGPGEAVASVRGPARAILSGERTALNFLGHLSGIASLTRRFVKAVEGTGARILDTRKTTPGWRSLEKAAVRAGGGTNHRRGLEDMVLIKENHVAAAGGLRPAVERVQAKADVSLPVEVEVRSLQEFEEALEMGVERILLDNMGIESVAAAVRRAREAGADRPLLEASGNVTLENVRALAETGVDFISVGALTHSAPCADFSLLLRLEGTQG